MPITELKVLPSTESSPEEHYYRIETSVINGKQTTVRFKTEQDYNSSLAIGEEIVLLAKKLYPEKYANIRSNI
jgi:hypothetical protein